MCDEIAVFAAAVAQVQGQLHRLNGAVAAEEEACSGLRCAVERSLAEQERLRRVCKSLEGELLTAEGELQDLSTVQSYRKQHLDQLKAGVERMEVGGDDHLLLPAF